MISCLRSWGQGVILVTCVFCASAAFASCSVLEIPGACIHFCEICLSASVCKCVCFAPACSQRFLFNSIQTVRAVERLESAGRQQSFGTSVIRGPWKCTHSLAQLAPKEVPA